MILRLKKNAGNMRQKKAEMNERSNRYNYNFIKLYIKYDHTYKGVKCKHIFHC